MSISRSLLFQCTLPGRRSPRYLATIVPLRVLGVCPALCRVLPLFLIFSIAAHFACSPRPLYSPRRWIGVAPDPAYRPRDIPLLGSRSGPSCFLCLGFSSGPVRARPRRPAEPKGVFPAQFLPPRVTDTVTLAPPGRHRGQSCPLPPASVHFGRVQQAMSALTTRWTQILLALSSASALFVDCQASSNPPEHMARAIASNALSTLERYFEQWISWCRHCDSAGFHPAAPPPGFLPDWLASRASAQGLATAPLKALAWMCQTAGLPSLRESLSSLCRAFSVASVRASGKPAAQPVLCGLARTVCLGSVHLTGTGASLGLCSGLRVGFPALGRLSLGPASPCAVSNLCACSCWHLRPHQDNEAWHALGSIGTGFLGLWLLLLLLAFSIFLGCATRQGPGLPACCSRVPRFRCFCTVFGLRASSARRASSSSSGVCPSGPSPTYSGPRSGQ